LNGNDPKFEPGITNGSMIVFLGMAMFGVSVVQEMLRQR
jgi:hypothetical protein